MAVARSCIAIVRATEEVPTMGSSRTALTLHLLQANGTLEYILHFTIFVTDKVNLSLTHTHSTHMHNTHMHTCTYVVVCVW